MDEDLTNRGGNRNYDWTRVQSMSYKDRESYLGYTTKIGYLDKGSKWKKRDWWTHSYVHLNLFLTTLG